MFNSGAIVTIINCVIRHFTFNGNSPTTGNGILIQPTSGSLNFLISNTILADNGYGGLSYYPPSGNAPVNGVIDHVTATNNQAVIFLCPSNNGGGTVNVAISNSIASNNVVGLAVGGTNMTATVDLSSFNNNTIGINAQGNR